VIEFSSTGFVYPYKVELYTFVPNIPENYPAAHTADYFRLLFSFWILYLYIGNILEIKGGKKNFKHAYSF